MDRDEYNQGIFVASGGRALRVQRGVEWDAKFTWPQVKAEKFLHAVSVQLRSVGTSQGISSTLLTYELFLEMLVHSTSLIQMQPTLLISTKAP